MSEEETKKSCCDKIKESWCVNRPRKLHDKLNEYSRSEENREGHQTTPTTRLVWTLIALAFYISL